ncbi:hypothetical protein [Rarobacter incanus]|uniref:hypothetical protein n=1 Tax=Rarobacter incanus TaxID=153494 RepID=UPI001151B6DC|nr:hypothetical protein [Rarobacter incanus]
MSTSNDARDPQGHVPPSESDEPQVVTPRRAPRFGRFVACGAVVGAVLGALASLIAGLATGHSQNAGAIALFCAAGLAAVGALVAAGIALYWDGRS